MENCTKEFLDNVPSELRPLVEHDFEKAQEHLNSLRESLEYLPREDEGDCLQFLRDYLFEVDNEIAQRIARLNGVRWRPND